MNATAPHDAGFSITVEPSGRHFVVHGDETILAAGIRQGIGLPYGCKDGACGSCKCSKLSKARSPMGPHQSKALSAEEKLAGFVLTCCAHAADDVVLESRQVTEAGAGSSRSARCRCACTTISRLSHDDVMVRLQLPANEPLQFHAGQYVEFILRDGARRSYSMANAPHTVACRARASSCTSATCRAASSPTTCSAR
jgi:CDP-4-dehydro-6-deoxyglucose reductase